MSRPTEERDCVVRYIARSAGVLLVAVTLVGCGALWRVSSFEVEHKGAVVPTTSPTGAKYLADRKIVDSNLRTILGTQGQPDYVAIEAAGVLANSLSLLYVAEDQVVTLTGSPASNETTSTEGIPERLRGLLTPADRQRLARVRGEPMEVQGEDDVGLQGTAESESVTVAPTATPHLSPTAAQPTAVPTRPAYQPNNLRDDEPFTPEGQVYVHTWNHAKNTPGHLAEKGSLNGVQYEFFYQSGSASFAGGPDAKLGLFESDVWHVNCAQDEIHEKHWCRVRRDDLWVAVFNDGRQYVGVGNDHYPGSTVVLRIDGGKPSTAPARQEGAFGLNTSKRLIGQLASGDSVVTRYMEWPNKYHRDRTTSLYGFKEALAFATWASKRMK